MEQLEDDEGSISLEENEEKISFDHESIKTS